MRMRSVLNAFARSNERSSSSSCWLNVNAAPNSAPAGLNFDFGAPGQSTLKIGDAMHATRTWNFSSRRRSFSHLRRVPAHDVLLLDLAQVDMAQAELFRGDLQRAPEVLRDLVAEYRDLEGVGVRAARQRSHRRAQPWRPSLPRTRAGKSVACSPPRFRLPRWIPPRRESICAADLRTARASARRRKAPTSSTRDTRAAPTPDGSRTAAAPHRRP